MLTPGRAASAADAAPRRPLRLWASENDPRARLVREALSSLQLEFEMRTAARGSAKHAELAERHGSAARAPFLEDPGEGDPLAQPWAMGAGGDGWRAIVAELFRRYAAGPTLGWLGPP